MAGDAHAACRTALHNEVLTSAVLRENLFHARGALCVALAKLDKVAAIARRLKDEGMDDAAGELLDALA
jgi:hypothetical protein